MLCTMPSPTAFRSRAALRAWLVFACALLLGWAGSVYTPWAVDTAPRLWLYDAVFYLRFVVGAWALAEALRLGLRREWSAAAWIPLALAGLCGVLVAADSRSEALLRWKVRGSAPELARVGGAGNASRRVRAAHFIVDGVSIPCRDGERWLWIGRPHGAGSGTSTALVRARAGVPAAPAGDAFRFRRLTDDWWMAYQHAARHARGASMPADVRATCTGGRELSSHRQGRAFIEAGWREFGAHSP